MSSLDLSSEVPTIVSNRLWRKFTEEGVRDQRSKGSRTGQRERRTAMRLLMRSQTTPQLLWRWDGPSELSPQKGKGTKPSHPHMDQSWDAGCPQEGSVILGLGRSLGRACCGRRSQQMGERGRGSDLKGIWTHITACERLQLTLQWASRVTCPQPTAEFPSEPGASLNPPPHAAAQLSTGYQHPPRSPGENRRLVLQDSFLPPTSAKLTSSHHPTHLPVSVLGQAATTSSLDERTDTLLATLMPARS